MNSTPRNTLKCHTLICVHFHQICGGEILLKEGNSRAHAGVFEIWWKEERKKNQGHFTIQKKNLHGPIRVHDEHFASTLKMNKRQFECCNRSAHKSIVATLLRLNNLHNCFDSNEFD